MANDPHRVLWCLIKSASNPLEVAKPFEVTAPVDASISKPQKLVWEEHKIGVLRGIDATNLVLWKVSSEGPEDGSRLTSYLQLKEPVLIKELAECTAIRGDLSECANELRDPSDTVLDNFSEAPQARSIHIIVELVGELTSACPPAFSLLTAFALMGIAGPIFTVSSPAGQCE